MWIIWNCRTWRSAIITHGLVVDTNFTIYFANANVDPDKLQRVYSNIVWVPQFAGPNSSTNVLTVPLAGRQQLSDECGAGLQQQHCFRYDSTAKVNSHGPFPLNNPAVGPVPCPSLVTSTRGCR